MFTVYRISWFRAKARKERWEEERILLESEMDWVCNYFKFKSEEWKKLAIQAEDEKKCGAFARSELWQHLYNRAKAEFDISLRHPPPTSLA